MKPSVLEQQLPNEDVTKGSFSRSMRYADTLTRDACRCPHLQEFLPHSLDLDCVPDGKMWKIANPVHALHLLSHTNPDGTVVSLAETDFPALYGDEQRRLTAMQQGGIAASHYPAELPFKKKSLAISDKKAPVAEDSTSAMDVEKTTESNGNSAPNPVQHDPLKSQTSTQDREAVSTSGNKGFTSPESSAHPSLGPVITSSAPPGSQETKIEDSMSTVPRLENTAATDNANVVPEELGRSSGNAPNVSNEPAGEGATVVGIERKMEVVEKDLPFITASQNTSTAITARVTEKTKARAITTDTVLSNEANPVEEGKETKLTTPSSESTLVSVGAINALPTNEISLSVPEHPRSAATEAIENCFAEKNIDQTLQAKPAVVARAEVAVTPPVQEYCLPVGRYQQLKQAEDQILKERKALSAKRKMKVEQVDKKKASSSQSKKRKDGGTPKKMESGDQKNASGARLSTLSRLWYSSNSASVSSDPIDVVRWEQDALRAKAKVEAWMDAIRLNRKVYWGSKQGTRNQNQNMRVRQAGFGGLSPYPCVEHQCDCANAKDSLGFGEIFVQTPCAEARDDELIQCLDCCFVGCAPCSVFPASEQHILQHFLQTGHCYGISCGARADLFCFRCGDFVYHELFEQEIERVAIAQRTPWIGWKEHAVQRSFDALNFVTTPDHGVVWRGLVAAYPRTITKDLLLSTRSITKRLLLFRGQVGDRSSLAWGPKALDFACRQALRHKISWKISAPIGLYNLGNTCFMSAVLQCLVHCLPLQRHFLRDVSHHYESCQILRKAFENARLSDAVGLAGRSEKTLNSIDRSTADDTCLACEMDLFFLRYFGSGVGLNVIEAIREPMAAPNVVKTAKSEHVTAEVKGEPLEASRLLTAAWRSGSMDHLAGYEQRDAHEFLNSFLETMGKHGIRHRNQVQCLLKEDFSAKLRGNKQSADVASGDMAKSLFEGTLRSVLICGECGCKRSQLEPFLNISLSLSPSKEIERPAVTAGTRKNSGISGLNVLHCLKRFTAPEALGDPVHCGSCLKKTLTKKQHTFAKLPKVLCMHLKRFDAAENKKIEDFVAFPARGLEMGPHLPHWCELNQGADASTGQSDNSPRILYDLFGTVNHTGTLNQGHYVSNVKSDGKWYHCNDAVVCDTTEEDVLKSDGAYVLFYIRR